MSDSAQRDQAINLALAQAKRVNRESRMLVQSLARLRDGDYPTTTAQEAQDNEHHQERR